MLTVDLFGESFVMVGEKALLRPGRGTLYVADVHIGKASSFARHGVPISGAAITGATQGDLDRLSGLIAVAGVRRLVILGDLLHAANGRDAHTLLQLRLWRESQARLEIVLVMGNHDKRAGAAPAELCIDSVCEEDCEDEGVRLRHHPLAEAPTEGPLVLAGHVHPAVAIGVVGSARWRAPCFWLRGRQMVLPAFGSFTGTAGIRCEGGDRVFAVGERSVVEVTAAVCGENSRNAEGAEGRGRKAEERQREGMGKGGRVGKG